MWAGRVRHSYAGCFTAGALLRASTDPGVSLPRLRRTSEQSQPGAVGLCCNAASPMIVDPAAMSSPMDSEAHTLVLIDLVDDSTGRAGTILTYLRIRVV